MITFAKIANNLTKNAETYVRLNNLDKAYACLELANLIREKGYNRLRGPVELSA